MPQICEISRQFKIKVVEFLLNIAVQLGNHENGV